VVITEFDRAGHVPPHREDVADESIGPGDPGHHEDARIRRHDDRITVSTYAARRSDGPRHAEHGRQAERTPDAIGGCVVAGRNQGSVGRPCRIDTFAQAARGHRPVLQVLFGNEEQIDIAGELEMLKPVVQEMDCRAEVPLSEPAGEIPVGPDQYRHTGKRARQHQRLVTRFVQAGDDTGAVGHNRHAVLNDAASVAPGQHGRPFACLKKQSRNVLDDRCLAAPSDAKVADADDGTLQPAAP